MFCLLCLIWHPKTAVIQYANFLLQNLGFIPGLGMRRETGWWLKKNLNNYRMKIRLDNLLILQYFFFFKFFYPSVLDIFLLFSLNWFHNSLNKVEEDNFWGPRTWFNIWAGAERQNKWDNNSKWIAPHYLMDTNEVLIFLKFLPSFFEDFFLF